jgi:hypothetical protein
MQCYTLILKIYAPSIIRSWNMIYCIIALFHCILLLLLKFFKVYVTSIRKSRWLMRCQSMKIQGSNESLNLVRNSTFCYRQSLPNVSKRHHNCRTLTKKYVRNGQGMTWGGGSRIVDRVVWRGGWLHLLKTPLPPLPPPPSWYCTMVGWGGNQQISELGVCVVFSICQRALQPPQGIGRPTFCQRRCRTRPSPSAKGWALILCLAVQEWLFKPLEKGLAI